MNKKTSVFAMLFCISLMTIAQQKSDSLKIEQLDEVVVTDSGFHIKRENSGKIITKITQQQLQQLQGKNIAEIINTVSGIEINGAKSNAGQNLSYFVRGGRNRQVLVRIDGVVVSDPSQISSNFDLRLVDANQVESIEILKGAASTLYGSGAATAVINITLKESATQKIASNFRSVLGTNQSQNDTDYDINHFKNNISVNGTLNKFTYLANFGNQFTNGLSAVKNGSETDAFNTYNGYLKFGFEFSNAFKIGAYGSFNRLKSEFDDTFTLTDANNISLTKQRRIGISPQYNYKKGSVIVNAAYNRIERTINSSFPSQFKAKSYTADVFNRYKFNNRFYTIIGINAQQNEMESFSIPFGSTNLVQSINPDIASFTIIDPYVNVVYLSKLGLNVNAGFRLNTHNAYGSHLVYNINPSYKKDTHFGYIKGLASYSTAFITPSLFQLFEPTYGNEKLQPEDNRTIEIGTEISVKNKTVFSLVYFNRKEKNFIDFEDLGGFVFQYKNTNKTFTASGIEAEAKLTLSKRLQLNVNATYTNVEDDLNLRIPEFKANTSLQYQCNEATFMSLTYQFNDDREDTFFNTSTFENDTVHLQSYHIFDVYASHKIIKDKLTFFANITNIFNEDYEELFGFSSKGRNVSFGFNLNL